MIYKNNYKPDRKVSYIFVIEYKKSRVIIDVQKNKDS